MSPYPESIRIACRRVSGLTYDGIKIGELGQGPRTLHVSGSKLTSVLLIIFSILICDVLTREPDAVSLQY